jgi:hypothetical protein
MHNVLVADDGELLLIREMLGEMNVPYHDGSPERDGDRAPLELLITNPRLALSDRSPPAQFHLVVYEEASKTLQQALTRSSCDLALQSPLDSAVFRMVVDRALYHGPERRRAPRAVLWAEVKVKTGLRQTPATLSQLSIRGCSLLMARVPKEGSKLVLTLPKGVTGAQPLSIEGRVIGSTLIQAERGSVTVSVRFVKLAREDVQQLASIVRQHAGHKLPIPGAPPQKPIQNEAEERVAQRPLGVDRRKQPRAGFTSQILASSIEGSRVLLGCDLSTGGMRVQPDETLTVGDEFKIALYARKGLPAVMVRAIVARRDHDGSLGLRFDDVTRANVARLEEMVAALPLLVDTHDAKPGVVVSQVLEYLGSEEEAE